MKKWVNSLENTVSPFGEYIISVKKLEVFTVGGAFTER